MRALLTLFSLTTLALASSVSAQTSPPPAHPAPAEVQVPASPPAIPSASSPAAASPGTTVKPTAREVVAACRQQMIARGLKRAALRTAINNCFKERAPDLAKAAACSREARAKQIERKDLPAFIRACNASPG